ncbi:hypothetical protein BAOM_3112 [Peribacillus asahii]|uniref:Uncharacterized protein n=1 Tax=Peribacillus asahii TaxID=228899 RepID=A0A3T0KU50_9BACI|nr:hypothetical protein [Peribacillus asahii]AZV43721.1 hypothetical protein BAOM_3112 [Peribacillus asahii]
MATSYQDIYARFLPKVTDYSYLNLTNEEVEDNLETFMKSSIIKFRYCNKLSDRDEAVNVFNENLTDEEQEILATLMCVEFLTPKLLTDDLLKQTLNSKDYSLYSQANHIKEIRQLRDIFQKEANNLMILYTFTKSKMDDFL